MGKVVLDISMSPDGFVTAANPRMDAPVGDGGLVLTEWAISNEKSDVNRKLLEDSVVTLGALISGRVTYDTSVPWWGANGPTGQARRPLFVVTHQAPKESPENGVYTFVTDGIEKALARAKAVAGEKDVAVMGGANIAQQYLKAGLVDDVSIHLVPVIFGSGTRLFDHLSEHIKLEPVSVLETPNATHLRYRVVK
jgi:dihydrofolate reductase